MSLRVYWKDEIENIAVKTHLEQQFVVHEHELVMFREDSHWYSIWHQPANPIPEFLADLVDEISLYETIPAIPKRECGVYRHKSAEAEVSLDLFSKEQLRFEVRIRAKRMEDAAELLQKIKVGSVRPEESYEGQQNGMSHAELEAELKRLQDKVEHMNLYADSLRRQLCGIHEFMNMLVLSVWPFCIKRSVVSGINEVIRAALNRD